MEPTTIIEIMQRVPGEVTPDVESLLDKLNVDFEPEMIPVAAEEFSTLNSSFDNVEEKVKRDGGKIHCGWMIMTKGYVLEAEYYAVWEDANQTLVDITPNAAEASAIMFVSDDTYSRAGLVATPNVRINITGSKLIDDYVLLAEAFDQILGMTMLTEGEEPWLPETVISMLKTIDNYKKGVEQFYLHDGKPSDPCHCGSNRIYNHCHGRGLKLLMEDIVGKARALVAAGPEMQEEE